MPREGHYLYTSGKESIIEYGVSNCFYIVKEMIGILLVMIIKILLTTYSAFTQGILFFQIQIIIKRQTENEKDAKINTQLDLQ